MSPCIMVVDDAMFMRKVLRQTLTQGGYETVIEAPDGETAVSVYEKEHPDLVILDITMPGKSGLEVLGELLELDAGAKVLMCSAVGQEGTVSQAIRDGAKGFITKPFDAKELLLAVKACL